MPLHGRPLLQDLSALWSKRDSCAMEMGGYCGSGHSIMGGNPRSNRLKWQTVDFPNGKINGKFHASTFTRQSSSRDE